MLRFNLFLINTILHHGWAKGDLCNHQQIHGSGKRKLTDAPRRVVSNMMDNLTCMVECTPFPSEHHTLPVIIPGLSFSSTKGKMWHTSGLTHPESSWCINELAGDMDHPMFQCHVITVVPFFLEIQQLSTIFEAPN